MTSESESSTLIAEPQSSFSGKLPRVAITFCTQCKWMLRAAYYAQELLSTFGTSIGEIALLPATGGVFTIDLIHEDETQTVQSAVIWDRKVDGGFPETKILKQKLRDFIEPQKNLGHSDTPSRKAAVHQDKPDKADSLDKAGKCEDC